MLLVKAIERSIEQTESCIEKYRRCGVWTLFYLAELTRSLLESSTKKGDSPVEERTEGVRVSRVLLAGYLTGMRGYQPPTLNTC